MVTMMIQLNRYDENAIRIQMAMQYKWKCNTNENAIQMKMQHKWQIDGKKNGYDLICFALLCL